MEREVKKAISRPPLPCWERPPGELLKDPKMLNRLRDISELLKEERDVLLHALDAKTRKAYSS